MPLMTHFHEAQLRVDCGRIESGLAATRPPLGKSIAEALWVLRWVAELGPIYRGYWVD
jgi:hypothetical protein